ncbi:MAG: hypothetical protein KIT11_07450 [Fimbriimonadaceae bacterium]|nr:hypothetical protein [Fimbriimonadaceae bacterium]QYK56187.1 MAG: hypothetical protein KF733_01640 [Fimbriimonadaceae bacterium]
MRRGSSMVGVLVAGLIVVVLAVVFAVGSGSLTSLFGGTPENKRPDGKGATLVGQSRYAAKDAVCRTQLSQCRQAVQVNTDPVENSAPASLEDLRLGSDLVHCPVGGERYDYDPATGRVGCPHKGHESY